MPYWKDENGETPCINSGGMYAAADFMDPMIENGAKNIWSNVKSPTLFGSPKLSAGNFFQKFLKHIPTYYREGQIVFCSFLLKPNLDPLFHIDKYKVHLY